MTYIDWVEIENFKGLDRKLRIPLGNPSEVPDSVREVCDRIVEVFSTEETA